MRTFVAIALLVGACCKGGATTPNGGPNGAKLGKPVDKQVKPLAIKADAKKQDQALILGTANGATVIPLVGRENEVGIEVMWVRPGNDQTPTVGGSSPVTMDTTPTGDNKVRVGVYEQYAGGAGPQMRSAVWIAAFVAATTLGKDLTDFKFAAESEGFVDGPSAGGLMTAGFLASLTGAKIDPLATMTGTVNPDGTIGPVGGIPHKFEGSIAKGKKKLGFPVGMRNQEDMNKHAEVDLKEVARAGGAQAIEISDIYEAYELMTGQKLPQPLPLEPREMELGDDIDKKMQEKVVAWMKIYEENAATVDALAKSGNLPKGLEQIVTWAHENHDDAVSMVRQGIPAAAYWKITRAAVYASTATDVAAILDKVADGDVAGARAKLQAAGNATNETEGALRSVGEIVPATISDHLLQMSAFEAAIAAFGYEMWGVQSMPAANAYLDEIAKMKPADAASPDVRDKLVELITVPVLMFTRGEAFALLSKEALEVEAVDGLAYKCSLPNAKRLAKSFGSAAAANLGYFDSVIIDEVAKELQVSHADAQDKFRAFDPRYLVARWAFDLPRMLPRAFNWDEDSLASTLAVLAGSILSYQASSSLMGEYYSLGVHDKDGKTVVEQEKAFINMLATSERKAREYANAAKIAVGQVPVQAKIAYQNARVLREGDTRDKLKALELFWQSSVYSQVAVMLARN